MDKFVDGAGECDIEFDDFIFTTYPGWDGIPTSSAFLKWLSDVDGFDNDTCGWVMVYTASWAKLCTPNFRWVAD